MLRTLAVSGLLALTLASAASAHVVFAEPEAAPNSYYAGFLRVSHGCGASPTRAIRVEIPEGINIARPQPKPGWTIEVERAALVSPIQAEGGHRITERVTAITWRGELAADQFDQFGIMMRLPAHTGAIYFPVIQTCAQGEQRWTQIPRHDAAWGSVANPAPVLAIAARQSADHGHARH